MECWRACCVVEEVLRGELDSLRQSMNFIYFFDFFVSNLD